MTLNDILNEALDALKMGNTLLYPTDTVWGIGCDACNAEAVEKIYRIKERDHSKSMLILGLHSDLPQDEASQRLFKEMSDKPTTFILPNAKQLFPNLADNLPAADGSIGIRIPNTPFLQMLLNAFGRPIVSTSANLSGQPTPSHYSDIIEEIKRRVDLCIPNLPEFESGRCNSSRIIKLNNDGSTTLLRP